MLILFTSLIDLRSYDRFPSVSSLYILIYANISKANQSTAKKAESKA